MRAYPIYYLTFILIGLMIAVGAFVGIGLQPRNPAGGSHLGFFMMWLPLAGFLMSGVSLIFWIFGLVHLLRNRAIEGNEQIVWLLVVIFLNALGAVLYFFLAPNPAVNLELARREQRGGRAAGWS